MNHTTCKPLAKLIFGFLFLSVLVPAPAFAAIKITAPAQSRVIPEVPDFAGRMFADPWDMSSKNDMSHGQYYEQISGYSFNNGILSGRSSGSDPSFHPLFPGYRDAAPIGRDGGANKIETSKYDSVSVRMYSSRRTTAQVLWFYNAIWTDLGSANIYVFPGWHTYNIDLSANSKWTGRPIGMRFDPTYHPGVDFKVDWIRLHKKNPRRVILSWTDTNPGVNTEIYLDKDNDRGNGNMELLTTVTGAATNSFAWDPGPFEPGSYYLYIKHAGGSGVYAPRIRINRAPLIRVLNPDERGGQDYARAETGNAWDMNDAADLQFLGNIKDVTFANGIMSGTNVGADGYIHLRVPKPIDTSKYHRLTFRYKYDGPFDFALGTMTRIIWTPDILDIRKYSTADDIVTYPEWREYTVDLKKMPLDSGIGWNGMVTEFRFDPLEVPDSWRFHLDFMRLAADDTANTNLTVSWYEARKTPRQTKVSLYYDTDRTGLDGKLIAKGLASVSGNNKYFWKTANIPAGTYWVYVVANDGLNVAKKYSTGPVQIRH